MYYFLIPLIINQKIIPFPVKIRIQKMDALFLSIRPNVDYSLASVKVPLDNVNFISVRIDGN